MLARNPKTKRPNLVTVHQAAPSAPVDLSLYGKDLHDWPRSWMGFPEDLAPGQKVVACFRPFLLHLIQLELSRKTIRKHVDNLWILGGEIIRDLNETPSLRKVPVQDLLVDVVDEGGPLLYHGDSHEALRSFEATCRKFRRFLEQQPHEP